MAALAKTTLPLPPPGLFFPRHAALRPLQSGSRPVHEKNARRAAQIREQELQAKRQCTAAARHGLAPPTAAPRPNKFAAAPACAYNLDARALLNTERPSKPWSTLVWTKWAAFSSQSELGTALGTGRSHVAEKIRDADYRLETRPHAPDALDTDARLADEQWTGQVEASKRLRREWDMELTECVDECRAIIDCGRDHQYYPGRGLARLLRRGARHDLPVPPPGRGDGDDGRALQSVGHGGGLGLGLHIGTRGP